jgi:hypothetical protein
MTITRISQGASGYAKGTSATATLTVNLQQAPVSGNLLVACIAMCSGSNIAVSSISQTNVTWTEQKKVYTAYAETLIWAGVVSASAGTAITVNLASAPSYGSIADVCEYSGLLTTGFLDKTASWTGVSPNALTGTTATTTQATELWIGATVIAGADCPQQATPLNSFTLLDGTRYGSYLTISYLEYIASATGTANSGASGGGVGTDAASGCIATFKGAASTGQQLFTLINEMNY